MSEVVKYTLTEKKKKPNTIEDKFKILKLSWLYRQSSILEVSLGNFKEKNVKISNLKSGLRRHWKIF